jgi:uncharacterized protein (TIGR00369 family)
MGHILDAVVAGEAPRTEYAKTLRLPIPAGWEPGRVWAEWQVDPAVMTPWSAVFGGYLAALTDEMAGMAALSVLEEGETFGTTELRVSPLRALREGRVRIEGRVISRGRSAIHVEVEFHREDGTLAAKGSAIQVLARATAD